MNGRARHLVVACAIALGATAGLNAQIIQQPTPTPIATAENESWYLNGEPITFEGSLYYPAGPQVHFRSNEMIRSGFYRGIPLYTRTTLEPFSVVFVPLPGGLMQPYQRQRAGEIAGTAGSITSPLPVEIAAEDRTGMRARTIPQAPAPPTSPPPGITPAGPERTIVAPVVPAEDRPVGTSGRARGPAQLVPAGERPSGINALFLEFGNRRWYPSGGPVPFDSAQFEAAGEYRGFPVYARRGRQDVIYIPITSDSPGLLAPYSTRRER